MFKHLSNITVKYRFVIVVFWVVLAVVIFLATPSLSSVSKGDQASFLPKDTDSVRADSLMRELFKDKGGRSSVVFILNRPAGLTQGDLDYLKALESYFDKNRSSYHIIEINSPFKNKETQKEMLSKDGKAAMLSVNLSIPSYNPKTNETIVAIKNDTGIGSDSAAVKAAVKAPIKPEGLDAAITGDAAMSQEENEAINTSMALTVKITLILVLLILVLVYRSPIAPLASLLTIGISFAVARGIIALMAMQGFKISSFTETFLIAVLFGAGTDYCLLLVSRYKEELNSGKASREALCAALPNTASAILSSGGTVMVGFLFMVFAKFGLFNATGPSVAIGMAITLLAVMTLLPSIIAILGDKLFWPAHPGLKSRGALGPSIMWRKVSVAVTTKPLRFIIISLLVLTPFFLISGLSSRSYDQLKELPSSAGSIKGFEMMKKSFNQGELMPLKIVFKAKNDMWAQKSLSAIDELAVNLLKVDNVLKVRTATRPLGEKITEISLPEQINLMSGGIGSMKAGINPIIGGLGKAGSSLDEMSSGGVKAGGDLGRLADGTKQAADGAGKTQEGLSSLSKGTQSVMSGINQINQNLSGIQTGLGDGSSSLTKASSALKNAESSLEKLPALAPELAADPDYLTALGTIKNVTPGLDALSKGLEQSKAGVSGISSGLTTSADGLGNIKIGIESAGAALGKLKNSLNEMERGQSKASSGIGSMATGLSEISKGLNDSTDALKKIESALDEFQTASTSYTSSDSALSDVFYLPQDALKKYPDLKNAMENYITPSGDGVVFDVVLSVPPYTKDALDTVNVLDRVVRDNIKDTPLEGAEFHIGGATSILSNVRDVTSKDFIVVMCLVLLGIFTVLVILLRSLTAPVYLILTIIFSYITTMGISYLVFQVLLGYDGLHWTVQFFSFCILVALGVDYNIFLMSRIREEYRPGDVTGSIERALSSTGAIITSCGLIMGGTFGAMMASPITPLFQIGFTATIGLLLDTFVIRCLLVPAIAVKFGEVNWWPGRKLKVVPQSTNAATKTAGEFQ